ncbi:MAG: hypothetical protein QM689_03895 [Oscillospiraceae bacterium]
MYGRYGGDKLGIALAVLSFLIQGVVSLFHIGFLILIAWIPLIFMLYRTFSKNIRKRQAENEWFLGVFGRMQFRMHKRTAGFRSYQTHKVFKCKSCGQKLRVPRGRGKINVTCAKCGTQTIRKT